jgi:4-hydroxy 2-oxovalerate aldolase
MAQKGDLMTARPDIRVLDATIRDGGLVNNFMFTDDFINALYRANVKASTIWSLVIRHLRSFLM